MNKITNFLCLSLLLIGASALGMNKSDEQLFDAAWSGNLKEVGALIAQGASVDAKDDGGWTPMFWAAHNGNEDVCRLLIEKKALIDIKNYVGLTPFVLAACEGHEAVCNLLIDAQLERARNKAGIKIFFGITRKRPANLPCQMQCDIAKMIALRALEAVKRDEQLVIEQINQLDDKAKAKWLAYLNEQMNSVSK